MSGHLSSLKGTFRTHTTALRPCPCCTMVRPSCAGSRPPCGARRRMARHASVCKASSLKNSRSGTTATGLPPHSPGHASAEMQTARGGGVRADPGAEAGGEYPTITEGAASSEPHSPARVCARCSSNAAAAKTLPFMWKFAASFTSGAARNLERRFWRATMSPPLEEMVFGVKPTSDAPPRPPSQAQSHPSSATHLTVRSRVCQLSSGFRAGARNSSCFDFVFECNTSSSYLTLRVPRCLANRPSQSRWCACKATPPRPWRSSATTKAPSQTRVPLCTLVHAQALAAPAHLIYSCTIAALVLRIPGLVEVSTRLS